MTDTDRVTIRLELDRETLRKIGEIRPAVTEFAKEHFGEPETGDADVIALAVHLLHLQTVGRAHAAIARAHAAAEQVEGAGSDLWPTAKPLH